MTTQPPTLTDFLLARIAETEALVDGDWVNGDGGLHIISLAADRWIRAECEAKRRIVEWAALDLGEGHSTHLARFLALPYAAHREWREEWRP